MKKKLDTLSNQSKSSTKNNMPRVFARQLSRQLTIKELEKVSGGEGRFDCTYTNFPEADFVCS